MTPSEKLARLRACSAASYTDVVELRVVSEPDTGAGGQQVDVELRLGKRGTSRAETLDLRFVGVEQLSFRQGTVPLQVLALQVEPLAPRQWDRVAYRVTDYENEVLELYCRDFEILPSHHEEVGRTGP